MLTDCELTPTFSIHNRSLILHYWTMVTVFYYSLVIINYCLELMHLRLSILLLVTIVDSLQVTDNHLYATRQLPPLFLCRPFPGQAKEYGKSILGESPCSCPEILILSFLLWGNISVSWLPRSLFVLVACVCFPWVSWALNSFLFLSKNLLIFFFFFFFFFVIHWAWSLKLKESSYTFRRVRLIFLP